MSQNNYFSIFDLKECFAIDLRELEKLYNHLQKKYHPDMFVMKTDIEKQFAEQSASLINTAYNCLKHPILRAQHLLHLVGVPVYDSCNDVLKPDTALLVEIMEIQETVEACDDLDNYAEIETMVNNSFASIQCDFARYYDNRDINQATLLFIKMQYLSKILTQLTAIYTKLQS